MVLDSTMLLGNHMTSLYLSDNLITLASGVQLLNLENFALEIHMCVCIACIAHFDKLFCVLYLTENV